MASTSPSLHDWRAVSPELHTLRQWPATRSAVRRLEALTRVSSDRAAALLAGGSVLIRQGQPNDAKLRLTKALKLAHGPLANHQLVSQACILISN